MLKAAEYLPPHELPSMEFPFQLITGRTLYQFHTRTKTGRAPQLQAAAPEVWVEASVSDATRLGWGEGDVLRITTDSRPVNPQAVPPTSGGISALVDEQFEEARGK